MDNSLFTAISTESDSNMDIAPESGDTTESESD